MTDSFAEAISILMPVKTFVGENEDGYITEPAEIKRMTEEEKQELFDSVEDDDEFGEDDEW